MGVLVPVALAQKPTPAPAPSPKPAQPANPIPGNLDPTQPGEEDLVQFLSGRVATNDGTSLPNNTLVERLCNENVRQQVYATPQGDFSMQMESQISPFVDATGDPVSQTGMTRKTSTGGIPRRDLIRCELRASVAGFRSNRISLMDLTPSAGAVDVGAIVVERIAKIKGMTLNASAYKAPSDARKAYEKGLEAEDKGKVAQARKYFEQALQIYPRYVSAWFQLGTVLEKESQKDSARAAYTQATTIDARFLPPYLSLAAMALEAGNWNEVLQWTNDIIAHDLLNHDGEAAGYLLDLDELKPAAPYFYNAVANYKLNKIEEAERSALKAERVDLFNNFPQLHRLLAQIFTRKKNYAPAILELRTYLYLVPHAKDADQVRERLAELETLNRTARINEKPKQN